MALVIKSNIKKVVKELQGESEAVTSVAEEVGTAMEKKVEDMLVNAIERAKANKRRTLQARDL
jgi:histone H3/H4